MNNLMNTDSFQFRTIPKEASIYGDHLPAMTEAMDTVLTQVLEIRSRIREHFEEDPIDHVLARIKSDESMREKCRRKELPETTESALFEIRDAIGIRVICTFLNDIYFIRDQLTALRHCEIIDEKDYIRHAKSNGYRSYHMILKVNGMYIVEIQLRTVSMDSWAALEHQLAYKKSLTVNKSLVAAELKRCADELASTDISMQTIRDMLNSGGTL